jgi:hypothetical protein
MPHERIYGVLYSDEAATMVCVPILRYRLSFQVSETLGAYPPGCVGEFMINALFISVDCTVCALHVFYVN